MEQRTMSDINSKKIIKSKKYTYDLSKKMLLIKNEPNDDVVSCYYDKHIQRQVVTFSNGKSFHYAYNNIKWLENANVVNLKAYKFINNDGKAFNRIEKCLEFKSSGISYLRFFFMDGTIKSYTKNKLKIERNTLSSIKPKLLFNYYKQISMITGLKKDDKNTLTSKYESIRHVGKNTILSKYLNAEDNIQKNEIKDTVLFPFGCNLSQITAVRNALSHQVSVIEGPPGTGKTQTILNIISNLVVRGHTVAIVSNNNDATNNVYEKLEKYGFSYIAAELGSRENKEKFISEKQDVYPNFSSDTIKNHELKSNINNLEVSLVEMLENKNKVATLKKELSALLTEQQYFGTYFNEFYKDKSPFKNTNKLSSKIILDLWTECQFIAEQGKTVGFFFKIKFWIKYKINSFSIFKDDLGNLIPQFKKLFYTLKRSEIEKELLELETALSDYKFEDKTSELSEKSVSVFKNFLVEKYQKRKRKIFTTDDLWRNSQAIIEEYPVILSSTYSAIDSLKDIVYDYVIVDEASQVDLATGVLAMACAKNIVIVGDLKQLPNVITNDVRESISSVSDLLQIPLEYRYEEQSLLSSVFSVFNKTASKTLLREHYRCHPKIIEFCNQKFYNGQLIIMTEDNNEDDVLKVHITSEGNHARGHVNQRQIDEIVQNIIPELYSKDLGIITPYRDQTTVLTKQLGDHIAISTVHKFQGRENNDIIISSVDNVISEFTDNPNMLNVAVSRAKNRLRLVVSDNEKNKNTNIDDLIKYIKYNNFEIKQSDIFSVFDMLYKSFKERRDNYLSKRKKVSKYDSENLMYSVIEDVLAEDNFSKLSVVVHQPLNALIRDLYKLDDDEAKYIANPWTHVDFLIYNQIDKSPVLAIEVDGHEFHKKDTKQYERDILKNRIFEKYEISLIRLSTTGSGEEEKLRAKLNNILNL
ncbi:MAG: AAA domain-containing protein [Brevinemataceae bacterium]